MRQARGSSKHSANDSKDPSRNENCLDETISDFPINDLRESPVLTNTQRWNASPISGEWTASRPTKIQFGDEYDQSFYRESWMPFTQHSCVTRHQAIPSSAWNAAGYNPQQPHTPFNSWISSSLIPLPAKGGPCLILDSKMTSESNIAPQHPPPPPPPPLPPSPPSPHTSTYLLAGPGPAEVVGPMQALEKDPFHLDWPHW